MLKHCFSAILASLSLASASSFADWPTPGGGPVPQARLMVLVQLEDGSVVETRGTILRDGVSGDLYVRHASGDSELRARAVDQSSYQSSNAASISASTLPPSAQGYWTTRSVVGPRGRVVGHEHVWVHYCQNCGRYHE